MPCWSQSPQGAVSAGSDRLGRGGEVGLASGRGARHGLIPVGIVIGRTPRTRRESLLNLGHRRRKRGTLRPERTFPPSAPFPCQNGKSDYSERDAVAPCAQIAVTAHPTQIYRLNPSAVVSGRLLSMNRPGRSASRPTARKSRKSRSRPALRGEMLENRSLLDGGAANVLMGFLSSAGPPAYHNPNQSGNRRDGRLAGLAEGSRRAFARSAPERCASAR